MKKARWEEHLRTMKEEEDMITEIYRQYKVTLVSCHQMIIIV